MDLTADPDLERFRQEIRTFIDAVLPDDIRTRQRDKVMNNATPADQLAWMRILHSHGRSVPHWPVEHGGCGWTPQQLFVFNEELYAADAPEFDWGGTHMLCPVLYTFGSDTLKARFLEDIRAGAYLWAQGFSEPGAGSDLANLRTAARRDGDNWIVDGQKIWTSGAAHAEYGFFLVRTDPDAKPQRGISFLIIKLDSPGVTIRQIPQINGEAHLCEVFLENVVVPGDHLIGETEQGWTYAKFLLEHERTTSSFIYWSKREFARAKTIAASLTRHGVPVGDLPAYRARLAHLEAELIALEWSVLRVLAGEPGPYPAAAAASVLKIRGSEIQQSVVQLQVDMLGVLSARDFPPTETPPEPSPLWPHGVAGRTSVALILRAATIYGGTKQVQKNILARLAFPA